MLAILTKDVLFHNLEGTQVLLGKGMTIHLGHTSHGYIALVKNDHFDIFVDEFYIIH